MAPRDTVTRRISQPAVSSSRTPTVMKSVIWPTPSVDRKRVTSTLVSGQ
jgi:hypothetical protein